VTGSKSAKHWWQSHQFSQFDPLTTYGYRSAVPSELMSSMLFLQVYLNISIGFSWKNYDQLWIWGLSVFT